jgi:hypothetical protein
MFSCVATHQHLSILPHSSEMLTTSAAALCGVVLLATAALPSAGADELVRSKLTMELAARAQSEGMPELHLARQVINRAGSYAPYSVPCPSGVTWVRSADVSYLACCQGVSGSRSLC